MREKFFIVRASATELEVYRAAASWESTTMSEWAREILAESAKDSAKEMLKETEAAESIG